MFGILVGAAVGALQAQVWSICWQWYGRPDFLFEDSSGSGISTIAKAFVGGFARLIYGGLLFAFEMSQRCVIRFGMTLGIVIPLALAVSFVVTIAECRHGALYSFNFIIEHGFAFAAALVAAVATSRRDTF